MDSSAAAASTPAVAEAPARSTLMLGALGVVFGDIGTSPIYALRESLKAADSAAHTDVVLGVLSLIFWAVTLVVAVKYVAFVMRADNQGEGGTMALLSLALPATGRFRSVILVTGLAGASLFFGDAMITPAISVLSAIEGLSVITPAFQAYVAPIAAAILIGLFVIQSHGSGHIGKLFGPLMLGWFGVLALVGVVHAVARPEVFWALDPRYAMRYVVHAEGWTAFAVLGSVFLALTGGEALYADMGHFGRTSIRVDWFAIVMPALVLNYYGQGALVLTDPAAASNPFFLLFPTWALLPGVVLTTAATIIASQAVISGAFALVQQAIQLGVLPRLDIRQTSEKTAGQVYVPQINWLLAACVLGLALGFRSSDALANAYGIAVAGDMLVTTVLVTIVAQGIWRWPRALVFIVAALFLTLDLTFLSANIHKIPAGGWVPLVVGTIALTLMLVWRRGRGVALARREEGAVSLDDFIARLTGDRAPQRVHGAAVYLTSRRDMAPAALLLNLKHNRVLHDSVIVLNVETVRSPRVDEEQRVLVEELPRGFRHLTLRFGFAEKPDVLTALSRHDAKVGFDATKASFFLGREVPVPSLRPELPLWQEQLYAFMTRNAVRAPDYFLIPPPQVVELGAKVEL